VLGKNLALFLYLKKLWYLSHPPPEKNLMLQSRILPFVHTPQQRLDYLKAQGFDFLPEPALAALAAWLVYETYDKPHGWQLHDVVTYGRVWGPHSINGPLVERFYKVYSHTGRWCWNSALYEENPSNEWVQQSFVPRQLAKIQEYLDTGTLKPFTQRQERCILSNAIGGHQVWTINDKSYNATALKAIGKYYLESSHAAQYVDKYKYAEVDLALCN
jgi:hypothetical protein